MTSRRGLLRVYLGAAPGAGKTFAMLDEGHRRAVRGTDVVVAYVETHGRPHTAAKIGDMEVIPRRTIGHRGASFTEMDLAAVLARAPEVALVDEMAHSNVPGAEHEKRWQDIERLLEAGINVISTVNVQHLESLNDVVQAITGVPQRETVPDAVVRSAEQVELVDITPEALRRRMAHGNIYQPDKIDAALSNYFRPGNLTALRELALLWLADSVDEGLQRYREAHGIASTWETRERVVVALTGGPEGEALLRRAARIAARATGGDLIAVHIARSDGLSGSSIAALDQQRLLVESLGGSYHSIIGDDVPAALLDFARAKNATQIVIGASRRKPLMAALTGPGTGATITRMSGTIDVHVVSHDYVGKGRVLPKLGGGLTPRRRLAGWITAAGLLAALVPICAAFRSDLSLASDFLLFLLVVVICSLVGGFLPAFAAAVVGSLLLNYYFVPPIHRFTISAPDNVLALIVFVIIATAVSRVVDLAARRSREAARSNAEAETLSTLAGSLLRGEQALPALLERIRETFAVSSVTLLRRDTDAPASTGQGQSGTANGGLRGSWTCVDSVGDDPCLRPEDGDTEVSVGDDLTLVLRGRPLAAEDQRVLAAFATQAAVAYQQEELTRAAAAAVPLAETDRVRTALLNAVSRDLQTPIATAKDAVASVLRRNDGLASNGRDELLEADDALDRLSVLVGNLLDLSRLQAGALALDPTPVAVESVIVGVCDKAGHADLISLEVSPELPMVLADRGLLERVIANLTDNALRFTGPDQPMRITASAHGDVVEVRVIDYGPGIRAEDRDAAFEPFRPRLRSSAEPGTEVGVGLAISRGFVEAMHGTIDLEDTPGGGLTTVVSLMRAPDGTDPVPSD